MNETAPVGEQASDESAQPRRCALLAQLERFFFIHGYRGATMDRLAKEMRCSKRALYELASNRKELFTLIVERWVNRIQRLGVEAEERQSDPRLRLAAYLEPGVTETMGMTSLFLTDLRELPAARSILDRHQRARMSHLSEILEEGVATGFFRAIHPQLVASVCLAGIEKMNEPAFLESAGLSFSEAFAELYGLLMTGLEQRGQ